VQGVCGILSRLKHKAAVARLIANSEPLSCTATTAAVLSAKPHPELQQIPFKFSVCQQSEAEIGTSHRLKLL